MGVFKDHYGRLHDGWVMVFIAFGVILLILGIWGLDVYFSNRACGYVCEANGDENAYRWDAGCWCRDGKGVYNPEDSRDVR